LSIGKRENFLSFFGGKYGIDIDKKNILTNLNAALSLAKYNNKPIHINCPAAFDFTIKTYPTDIWTTKYHYDNFASLINELKNQKFAIFIGEHKKFNKEEEMAISNFAISWGIPVFCDHTANYHGKNKILITQYKFLNTIDLRPNLIIDLGGISGVYNKGGLFNNAKLWRISQTCKYNNRHDTPLTNLLVGTTKNIFNELINKNESKNSYYNEVLEKINSIKFKDIPHSITLVAQQLAKNIPENSALHVAILRSLESIDVFTLPESVDVCCNVGGFGIDGPVSTALGQALANPKKKTYLLTGDLAFFYDMNILGNRHIPNNLRILLVNNHEGVCMRFNSTLEDAWGTKPGVLVTAAGHYKGGAKAWAESCGFKYITANNKEDLLNQIDNFCNGNHDAPVLFEVFTTVEQDKEAVKKLRQQNPCAQEKQDISLLQKVFSVKNEISRGTKHKVIRVLGAKIKLKVKK